MPTACFRKPTQSEQAWLNRVELTLFGDDAGVRTRFDPAIEPHHHWKRRLVGEQVRYVGIRRGPWIALLRQNAAAWHLRTP